MYLRIRLILGIFYFKYLIYPVCTCKQTERKLLRGGEVAGSRSDDIFEALLLLKANASWHFTLTFNYKNKKVFFHFCIKKAPVKQYCRERLFVASSYCIVTLQPLLTKDFCLYIYITVTFINH